ncbi:hypothetical protein M8C21_014475 [Ambrosia artemisiifolia]|uniref:F-box domain, Leucine-rich repeat domain, L domain-like protein n=1 Tax=Ambrosia artemisiifolia TaxID=4212 RepID=A0AAD5GXN7_AMBAR|nr:hypothetical protein M8C21_014475 [Ambrosia artemisiifolia]
MDRISELPDFIVHHILSFFQTSPADLVRMSVLSKTWFHLTASFPVLYFNIHNFTSRERFFKYVEYTTSRFCNQNLAAHRLKLITSIRDPTELDMVDRCLGLLLRNGVNELVIRITDSSNVTKSPSAFAVQNCPLLQVFNIHICPRFKSFFLRGHQNLQKILISYDTRVERIDIEAPNLSSICITSFDETAGAAEMNLALCKKLKSVIYIGHRYPLPNLNGTDFLSNFPFVETFYLATMKNCNNIKFSSASLRSLVLHSDSDLEEIEFTAPNLDSFSYPCDYRALSSIMDESWPPLRDATHLKACMRCYPVRSIDAQWFQKLRRFLNKKNGFKVLNLYIQAIYSQNFMVLEKLKAVEAPPYELEHVELQLETHAEPLAHIAFVDAVLWCCRPRSLTFRSSSPLTDFQEQNDVVKFTYEKLLQQEEQGHTNIQIITPSSSFLMALSGEGKAISFIKEEGDDFES